MDCSTPSLPVHHQLPEFTQTHVHWVGDAFQPSHPLLPLLLLPSIFPSIRVFSNESVLCIRWPKHWSFSFSISPSSEYSGLISFRIDWLDFLQSKGLSRIFSVCHSRYSNLHFHCQCKRVPFSFPPSPVFIVCRFLNNDNSDLCKVVPHCSLDLHFSSN